MRYEYRGANEMQTPSEIYAQRDATAKFLENLYPYERRLLLLNVKLLAIRSDNWDIYDYLVSIEDDPKPYNFIYAINTIIYTTQEHRS